MRNTDKDRDIIRDRAKYTRGWVGGLPETECGYGSRLRTTAAQRDWIPEMVEKYDIRTIGDIGAGDLNWWRHVQLPEGVSYQAFDLIPRQAEVLEFDIVEQTPPRFDLLLCIWVLNHFPSGPACLALNNLRASGSRYLMLTYSPRMHDFLDLPALEAITINREKETDLRLIKL